MRMLENTNFEFVKTRGIAYVISAVLIALSILAVVVRGVEWGIDFRGGMEFVVETTSDLNATAVRSHLADVLGAEPEVKTYGDNALLVRTLAVTDIAATEQQIVRGINERFPEANAQIVKTDIVGPRFANDLKQGAAYSILGSLLVIFVYILVRFEWRYGFGAVASLFHDVIITIGFFSAFHGVLPFSLQIDQTIVAALMTIVGYSINDTVVVFDRVREYTNMFKTEPFDQVVNRSINNTLSRTIITSGSILLMVLVLFIFGGDVLRGFAAALLIGIGIGTYSSIYVAAPIMIELRHRSLVRRR